MDDFENEITGLVPTIQHIRLLSCYKTENFAMHYIIFLDLLRMLSCDLTYMFPDPFNLPRGTLG